MATPSNLLRSAEAARKRLQQQEMEAVAYEWSLSAKTYEEFLAYSRYLEGIEARINDPSEKLSIQRTINSARRSYVSEEIKRMTNDVLNGRMTNSEKYEKIVGLFHMAYDNEDYSLAQNLGQQLDNLSVQIQKEYESAQRVTGAMALNGVKSLSALIKKFERGDPLKSPDEDFLVMPDGTLVAPLARLDEQLKRLGDAEAQSGYWNEVYTTVAAIYSSVVDAYNASTTQEAADKIASDYATVLDGTRKFTVGGISLSIQDIDLARRSAAANNPVYSIIQTRNPNTGEAEFRLQKNKVDDFVWVRNDDGTFSAVETRAKVLDPLQSLDTQITNEGYIIGKDGSIAGGTQKVKRDDSYTIRNRLLNMGYQIGRSNDDGTFQLIAPDGVVYDRAVIMPNGSIRYFGKPGEFSGGLAGLYEIDILRGDVTEVNPLDTSIFGTRSAFGGLLSQASDEGKRFIDQLAGVTKPRVDLISPLSRISLDQDFSGRGTQVFGSALQGTTNILQGSEIKREQQRQLQELQKAEAARALQRAEAFNLNQMPVGNMPNRALQVAPLPPQPKISIAPSVTPNTKITVSNGPPTPKISGVVTAAPVNIPGGLRVR